MMEGDAAVLTCSWHDASLTARTAHLFFEEGGMEVAEQRVQEALHATPPPTARVALPTAATTAPALTVTVGRCGIVALCVVANARVLEIHDGASSSNASATTVPLLTQEAQLADGSTGLYAHFLCHGGGGALFPPHSTYQVKLFGRKPRAEVCVVLVCLVLLPPSPEEEKSEKDASASPVGAASAAAVECVAPPAERGLADVLCLLQGQMMAMERRIGVALDTVALRLTRVETRVDQLEAAASSSAAQPAADEVSSAHEDEDEAHEA